MLHLDQTAPTKLVDDSRKTADLDGAVVHIPVTVRDCPA